MIYAIPEIPTNSLYKRQIVNNKFRYEGFIHGIKYCIDSSLDMTETKVGNILNDFSLDFLLEKEGYIINFECQRNKEE